MKVDDIEFLLNLIFDRLMIVYIIVRFVLTKEKNVSYCNWIDRNRFDATKNQDLFEMSEKIFAPLPVLSDNGSSDKFQIFKVDRSRCVEQKL
jgi:hypothetical protein